MSQRMASSPPACRTGPWIAATVLAVVLGGPLPLLASTSPAAPASTEKKADPLPPARTGPGASFIPFGGYSTDFGLEGGALASFYWFTKHSKPYALRVDGLIFLSTRLQSYYFLSWDAPAVLGSSLRLGGRLGLANALSENYCGMGHHADCSAARAEAAADQFIEDKKLDASPATREELSRKYYWYRLVAPTVGVFARYGLNSWLQLFGRYDVTYFMPNPYPVSRLQEEQPFGVQQGGLSSVPQVGLVVDTRDFEPAPTFGTFSEATVRVSSPVLGSSYAWLGFNGTFRMYVPLIPSRRLVFATRFIADLMFGNVPFYEQGYFGGTDSLNGIGGERGGRGMRFQRYRGKGRFLWTPELRATPFSLSTNLPLLGQMAFDLGGVLFMDVGKVVAEWPEVEASARSIFLKDRDGHSPTRLVFGAGVGLRFTINKLFIMKADFAWSPEEPNPGIYLNVNHAF